MSKSFEATIKLNITIPDHIAKCRYKVKDVVSMLITEGISSAQYNLPAHETYQFEVVTVAVNPLNINII